ncbi:unnamed protein product [Agarophyton chilense]
MSAHLRYVIRDLRQAFPTGSWHSGDIERIAAHLVALPIALKMHLRGEREHQQLEGILCPEDIRDLLKAQIMPFHCTRIVRTYFSAAQDDAPISFASTAMQKSPAGLSTRHLIMNNVDSIDAHSGVLLTISKFKPSAGYVNHLEVFLYIWMFFLPLTIVATSGWYTVLWTVLISYSIAMLFSIAQALNDPFGYDMQDIKLNQMAAETSLRLIKVFSSEKLDYLSTIDPHHDTPLWLEQPSQNISTFTNITDRSKGQRSNTGALFSLAQSGRSSRTFSLSLLILLLWTALVVSYVWMYTRSNDNSSCRWWCIDLPFSSSTDAYLSLGLFLILGFWLNDAYKRYSRGIELWQSSVKPRIEQAALFFSIVCNLHAWHARDRERLFSYLAALPYTAKQVLRDSRDTSELHEILSKNDVAAFDEADNLFEHAMDVIYGYINSLDCGNIQICALPGSPLKNSEQAVAYALRDIGIAVQECVAIHSFPISSSLTMHLEVFTIFWLALLPLLLVKFNGVLVFFYIIPIGFSVMKLLEIGKEISDPFGSDEHDIPLDTFCQEIKHSLYEIYQNNQCGTIDHVHESDYSRELFKPREDKMQILNEAESRNHSQFSLWKWLKSRQFDEAPSLLSSISQLLQRVPSLRTRDMVLVILWNLVSVLVSYTLSFWWTNARRTGCHGWCSPIDVDLGVLRNVGFALFLILSFRASDAIGRYEDGVRLIFDLKMNLRTLAIELCQTFGEGTFHNNDKERIVAHIVQVPLSFRRQLLSEGENVMGDSDGLLSNADKKELKNKRDPLSHLLQTIETYIILQDKKSSEVCSIGDPQCRGRMVLLMLNRTATIRELLQKAFTVKRFPVVKSYTDHQSFFTIIWLVLLPFAMTPTTGFFTLLLAPIISYGVLALEEISIKLVDPYGNDDIDIPVEHMCLQAATFVLDGVNSAGWDCQLYIKPSPPDSDAELGVSLRNGHVGNRYSLPRLEKPSQLFGCDPLSHFDRLEELRTPANLYSHLLHSVPWTTLTLITCYTSLATVISFVSRNRSEMSKWWFSQLSLDKPVSTYVSFAAFLLLGFYVNAAFTRYKEAGNVWASMLHSSCRSLAVHFLTLFESGSIHKGDHDRVIAHIAAIPLILKSELRNSRDTREVKGLLSREDLARVHCAESMSRYCVEVIKTYQITAADRPEYASMMIPYGSRFFAMEDEMELLEKAIQQSDFLSSFPVAPGFLSLLNALLGIWFLILPFALIEISGWFTILWVFIIGFGVLGMYTIAAEIQHPFGSDMNDFDLDTFAHKIVSDILFIGKYYKCDGRGLSQWSDVKPFWKTRRTLSPATPSSGSLRPSVMGKLKLASNAISPPTMVYMTLWTAISIALARLVAKYFPFEGKFNESCKPWFCSRIALDSSVAGYIGFALFLLLGFRLLDSHGRYARAIQIWQKGVFLSLHLVSNRIFESYTPEFWHSEDIERIAAHLVAFPIALKSELRGTDCRDELEHVLGDADTQKVLSTQAKANYCVDVVHNYVANGERMYSNESNVLYPAATQEVEIILKYLHMMKEAAFECSTIIRVPLPFGYVQHLRILLVIWLVLLPLTLIESSGWLTVLWVGVITYGVHGIEVWASELSDPFGYDISDVPLDEFIVRCTAAVMTNLRLYRNGVKDTVETERSGLAGVHQGRTCD